MDFVAAIDQGTTSSRCMIFDAAGAVVGIEQLEHEQILPEPGRVEHDPLEIRDRTYDVVRAVLARHSLAATDLAAVGITNQRETTVVWDPQTGKPWANAIVWQDTRTDAICRELARDGGRERFRDATGLPPATYFSGPKLYWLLEHVEGLREAAEDGRALFGTIDSWLAWNLTGGPAGGRHVTDVTNASRTLMMNLETMDWDPALLQLLGIPRRMLPEIRSSSDSELGVTHASGPFGGEVRLTGLLGDQQAALFGQACLDAGQAKNTYGTGCFMLLNTGTEPVPSRHGLLSTVAYRLGDDAPVYALEGSVAVAGALVQWLRDNLGLIERSEDVEALAATVEDSAGIYFVPAFSGLFAPHWRDDARGVIVGLTRYVNRGHIARAALEATAYQTREVLDAMHADSGIELDHVKVDGGMVVNDALMQFQADLLGVPVIRPVVTQTTALGAAYAAGLAVGFWRRDDLRRNWRADREWRPRMEPDRREELYRGWRRALERSLDWVDGQSRASRS